MKTKLLVTSWLFRCRQDLSLCEEDKFTSDTIRRFGGARPFQTRHTTRDRGYVLLAVLAVSVLVLTVLGTLARRSLRRGLEAADAERGLQQRWGALTLERALMPNATQIFQQQEELAAERSPGVAPPQTIRSVVTLGRVSFDLLLGDEDAKLNLNSLYHHAGQARTTAALAGILGVGGTRSVSLRPVVQPLLLPRQTRRLALNSGAAEADEEIPDAFRSWGEVFDLAALPSQFGTQAALPNITTGITCWGNGQLNFRRASDQAILAIAGSIVQDGGAQRLLKRYRQRPNLSLTVLLQTEVSGTRDRDRLQELLSETSTNFSLWIDASTKSNRSLRSFTVMRRDEQGVTRQTRFLH